MILVAGGLVPGDGVILHAEDCYVSQAALTGESFPVLKTPGTVDIDAVLTERTNCVYLGTNVRSGTARCLIVNTGSATEFGAIAIGSTLRPPDTEFDRGIRHFGYLLTGAMLIMVLLVFVGAHVPRAGRPSRRCSSRSHWPSASVRSCCRRFSSVNLARGAQMMARRGVLVRRLNAIENLGSMNVLCTDKTGTLTEGVVQLEGAYDPSGTAVARRPRAGGAAMPHSRPASPTRSTRRSRTRDSPISHASASSPRCRSTSSASA